jgi:hypothetical protein
MLPNFPKDHASYVGFLVTWRSSTKSIPDVFYAVEDSWGDGSEHVANALLRMADLIAHEGAPLRGTQYRKIIALVGTISHAIRCREWTVVRTRLTRLVSLKSCAGTYASWRGRDTSRQNSAVSSRDVRSLARRRVGVEARCRPKRHLFNRPAFASGPSLPNSGARKHSRL